MTERFYTVLDFMVTDLKLKGLERDVYAIIYGFCQAGKTYNGGLQYLADWTLTTKQGVIKVLKKLEQKGLLIKEEKIINNVKFNEYRTVNPKVNGIKQSLTGGSTQFNGGIKQSLPNNIDYRNKLDNIKEYDISTLHSDISNKKDEPSLDTCIPDEKNGTGKDTDKPPIPKVPYEKIRDLYNSICLSLPKCTLVSEKRKTSIKAVTSKFQTDQIEEAFRKAEASDFLTGRSKTGWSGCSFDWLMNTNNMLKVLEGNYDNRGKHEFTEDDFVLE